MKPWFVGREKAIEVARKRDLKMSRGDLEVALRRLGVPVKDGRVKRLELGRSQLLLSEALALHHLTGRPLRYFVKRGR